MTNIEEYIHNPIKRHIIGLLMKNKKLKYSELMPDDVDNVLFNYHLQHLVKNNLLDKQENYYSLSIEGLQITANVTSDGLYFPKFVCRYKLYVIDGDKVLLQHRQRTPWVGDITALSSKLVQGIGIEERATFRTKEKAGIKAKMTLLGSIRTLAFNTTKDLIDDSIYFVCYSTTFTGEVKKDDDSGDPLQWYSFNQAIDLEKKNKGSGDKSVEILNRLKDQNYTQISFEEQILAETA